MSVVYTTSPLHIEDSRNSFGLSGRISSISTASVITLVYPLWPSFSYTGCGFLWDTGKSAAEKMGLGSVFSGFGGSELHIGIDRQRL